VSIDRRQCIDALLTKSSMSTWYFSATLARGALWQTSHDAEREAFATVTAPEILLLVVADDYKLSIHIHILRWNFQYRHCDSMNLLHYHNNS